MLNDIILVCNDLKPDTKNDQPNRKQLKIKKYTCCCTLGPFPLLYLSRKLKNKTKLG